MVLVDGFGDLTTQIWRESEARCPDACYSLDCWHGCLVWLRTKLKGWNIKRLGEQKKKKKKLMDELHNIDSQAKLSELSQEEWIHRYKIERHLEDFYVEEELYWRQRMGKHWLMAGDSNTKFFHQFVNGRRRKGNFIQLENDQGVVKTQEEIMGHAV